MHCQGCGAGAGEMLVSWHHCRDGGQWRRYSCSHGAAVLTETDMAGWRRILCQRCREHAEDLNFNRQVFGLARRDKAAKAADPDPRQLTF